MKKSQLLQIIREEAQKAVAEINLASGHASSAKSLSILRNSAYEDLWDGIIDDMNDPSDEEQKILDAPISANIRKKIEKDKWDSQGDLVVTRTISMDDSDRTAHYLFNFAEPLKTACVGVIETSQATGPYSTKTMFNMPSVTIHWSNIAEEYKGYKYGAFLYDTILMNYGAVESDSTLFEGSLNMWRYHMAQRASAFVGTLSPTERGWQNTVVPLTPLDLNDKSIIEKLGSFIAFYGKVPKEVAKIKKLTAGTSLKAGTLGVIEIEAPLTGTVIDRNGEQTTWLDLIDNADSLEDLMETDSTDFRFAYLTKGDPEKFKSVIISFENAVMVVKITDSGLQSDLI